MISAFDTLPRLDWTDLRAVHQVTAPVLKALARDPSALRAHLDRAAGDPRLFALFERHQLLDYFVLADEPERNFRARLHLHTPVHKERPHNHRFAFTTFVMRGRYRHMWNVAGRPLNDLGSPRELQTIYETVEQAGSCYTISAEAIHTTYTLPGSVSLIIRGPTCMERSIIADRETDAITWRYGREQESPERRRKVTMSREDFHTLRGGLIGQGVLS